MQYYHYVWLAAHPERSREWLERHVADGFEIHHRDHNHLNNDPDNLVLIEGVDHHRLHGRNVSLRITRREIDMVLGEISYHARKRTGLAWQHIADKLKIAFPRAEKAARHYAKQNGLEWPLPAVWTKSTHKRPVYRGY